MKIKIFCKKDTLVSLCDVDWPTMPMKGDTVVMSHVPYVVVDRIFLTEQNLIAGVYPTLIVEQKPNSNVKDVL